MAQHRQTDEAALVGGEHSPAAQLEFSRYRRRCMCDLPTLEESELPDRTVLARRRELPRVIYELHILRQQYLPALLSSRRLIYPGGRPAIAPGRSEGTARRLHQWRSA